ncbi:MAG: heme-binding protein [Verrucomicrobiota bacterium]|nr:heme-binding protein [Verrucomicrobiota bacterium]
MVYCPPPYPPAVIPSPGTFGTPIAFTSLDGSPGGVPLYKNGVLVGGIGVTGDGTPQPPIPVMLTPPIFPLPPCIVVPVTAIARNENPFVYISGSDVDEDVALAGQKGYTPSSSITANNVFIGGIRLPYVNSSTSVSSTMLHGNYDPMFPPQASPGPPPGIVPATFGGVAGEIRQRIISDPLVAPINGQARLSAAEVASIINYAAARVKITRAAIRLPIGTQMQAFISVVNNPNADNVAPTVLGTFRTGEATIFSWDVAVQKARTALFYSRHDFLGFGLNIAMSSRCVGFLAQRNYPPGIDRNSPGPFFTEQDKLSGFSGTEPNLTFTAMKATPNLPGTLPNRDGIRGDLPNGITIFPGGFPLYRNGVLIGAIGVSGDGVDQDDIVGASGCHDFLAPFGIRSDQFFFRGTRLPYAKFPRDPTL